MTVWIVLLRAIGTTLAVASILYYAFVVSTNRIISSDTIALSYLSDGVARLALILLCFGAAAALKQQQKIDRKLSIVGGMLKQRQAQNSSQNFDFVSPARPYPDLAPVAPDWEELPTGIPFNGLLDKRLGQQKRRVGNDMGELYEEARGVRVGTPTVREAPAPIRQTPGTEMQYGVPPSLAQTQPTRPVANPSNPFHRMVNPSPDRETRRMARDAEIRRLQQEQQDDRE